MLSHFSLSVDVYFNLKASRSGRQYGSKMLSILKGMGYAGEQHFKAKVNSEPNLKIPLQCVSNNIGDSYYYDH